MQTQTWTGREAAQIIGCAYSSLDAWDRANVVKPTTAASGPGSRRGYTFQDLLALAVAFHLRRADVPRRTISLLVQFVQQDRGRLGTPGEAARANVVVVTDGAKVVECDAGTPLPRALLAVPVLVVVPLAPIVRELSGRLGRRFRIPPRKAS